MSGLNTGFIDACPVTSSLATITGALSTVIAEYKERLRIERNHPPLIAVPAVSYAMPVAM